MKLRVELGRDSYDITIEKNAIKKAGELFNLNRKVMIVTDSGVPEEYGDEVYDQCKEASITVIPEGEENKNFEMIETILGCMIERGFTRGDAVVAVGGGVVGDMAGFAASIYMRGIDFYNIPTTVLSQMDSSIGGKTAVDFKNYKNAVGSFYQPKGVIIDPVLIETLPDIEVASGLAESVKMAATFDEELFKLFETEDDPIDNYEEIVTRSLMIKKKVVEEDTKETGVRKVLNFGHTIGHAIESTSGLGKFTHGQCVAFGMMYTSTGEAKERIRNALLNLELMTRYKVTASKILSAVTHDKKSRGDKVSMVFCDKIGTYRIEDKTLDEIKELVKKVQKEDDE